MNRRKTKNSEKLKKSIENFKIQQMMSRRGSPPNFDYHLTPKEQKSVEKMIPLHQAKIHIALRADLIIDDDVYEKGACCLSEHLLLLAKKRFFGRSFTELNVVHLLDLTSLETHDDYTFSFTAGSIKVKIYTGEAMRLARNIFRDYLLSASILPQTMRLRFETHDPRHFPPFKPSLSPSQIFQFTYNAYCSYFDSSYFHDAVKFYHKNLLTGQGIIDLNQLPLSLIEYNLRNPMDLRPFFHSLMHSPYIFAICGYDINRPDMITSISPLIANNKNLHILSLENCYATTGTTELAAAIQGNQDIAISYWDLSNNPFEDSTPLMASFLQYPSPIFYLDLNGCNLSKQSVELLFKALIHNKNLWKIQHLHIRGSHISDESAHDFQKHYKDMNERGYLHLESLDLGLVSSGIEKILETLVSYPQPLISFKIPNTKLKNSAFTSLISLIASSEKLLELDISGTNINVDQVCQVITTISRNENLTKFKLWLGNLNLSGKKLLKILSSLESTTPKKWISLSFEENGLDNEDLEKIIEYLPHFRNLNILRIGKNFSYSNKGIGEVLVRLLDFKHLMMLSLIGTKSKGLRHEIFPFLHALKRNTSLKSLDIRSNYFKCEGLDLLSSVVKHNKFLNELKYDGCRPEKISTILSFLDNLTKSESIISCSLPRDDVYKALAKLKSKERDENAQSLSDKQENVMNMIFKNMATFNIHSFLASKKIQTLDSIIDDSSVELVQALHRTDLNSHSGISSLIGIPLPFQNINDTEDKNAITEINTPGSEEYESPGMNKQITETVDHDLADLQTLQFNSLCIRRPGAVTVKTLDKSTYQFTESEDYSDLEISTEEAQFRAHNSTKPPLPPSHLIPSSDIPFPSFHSQTQNSKK